MIARQITDLDGWMKSNNIERRWSEALVNQIKSQYPYLAKALRDQNSNRPELDLVLMVKHLQEGRFPVTASTKRGNLTPSSDGKGKKNGKRVSRGIRSS
jgi:hypothetical protein